MRVASAALTVLAMLAESAPVAAAAGDGVFESRGFRMPVGGALAYRGKGMLDKSDVIVVAISNAEFRADYFAGYHDRGRAVEKRMKDRDTAVVYLEFKPDGAYRGLSYYFVQGNNCGYCGGGVDSTVKLAGGKLVGTLKMKDEARTMDVKLDVPVLSDDHGAALPVDGGEPGKAYAAYHDALVGRDVKALRAAMSEEYGAYLDPLVKKGKAEPAMRSLAREHPEKSMRVVQGWSKGTHAVLLVAGEGSVVKLAGEAILVNEGGRWRVDDELMDVVLK